MVAHSKAPLGKNHSPIGEFRFENKGWPGVAFEQKPRLSLYSKEGGRRPSLSALAALDPDRQGGALSADQWDRRKARKRLLRRGDIKPFQVAIERANAWSMAARPNDSPELIESWRKNNNIGNVWC